MSYIRAKGNTGHAEANTSGRPRGPLSGAGFCIASASSTERSHCSTSAVVINMTGIAFSWMGSTTPLGSVVIIEIRMWAPMVGSSHGPLGRRAPAVML